MDQELIASLQKINIGINRAISVIPPPPVLRGRLKEKGRFIKAQKLADKDLLTVTGNRSVAAVDGSRVEYGSFYPYFIALLRTLALSTAGGEITSTNVITSLDSAVFNVVEKMAQSKRVNVEEAFRSFLKDQLAAMELEAALKAVDKFQPALLLLDGGFLLFDHLSLWDSLVQKCLETKTMLAGVIEEVATAELANWLDLKPADRSRIYDREILFGLFEPGEYLKLNPGYKVKKNYCTVFARLASSPQAVGFDILAEQEEQVENIINLLYTLSPDKGQGIPFWLQMVDAKVRLRRAETDRLITNCLDESVKQRIFKPNRESRAY